MCKQYSEIISFVDRRFESLTDQARFAKVSRSSLYRCLFKGRTLHVDTWRKWRNYILGKYAYIVPVSPAPLSFGLHHGAEVSIAHDPDVFIWLMFDEGAAIIVVERFGDVETVEHLQYDKNLSGQYILSLLRDRVDMLRDRRTV